MDIREGRLAVLLARKTIENYVSGKELPEQGLPPVFSEKRGAFVSLHTYQERELRGCIGYPEPVLPLWKAIADSAVQACRDPRFPPLQKPELPSIIVEVSVLTPPEVIRCPDPKDYPRNVRIGKDGLIIRKSYRSGLLLPQVATEHSFSAKEFLEHTCMKAGLSPDSWMRRDCVVCRFQADVFSEKAPGGSVEKVGE